MLNGSSEDIKKWLDLTVISNHAAHCRAIIIKSSCYTSNALMHYLVKNQSKLCDIEIS